MSVHFACVATDSKYYLPYLLKSCERHGHKLKLLGFGEKWKGFNWRFMLMLDYLYTLNPDDIVFFTDAYDVMYVRDVSEIKDVFLSLYNQHKFKIIVAINNNSHTNIFNKILTTMVFGLCDGVLINAGTYAGYVKDIIYVLKNIIDRNNDPKLDDQVLLTKYYNLTKDEIYIDRDNDLFLTIDHPLHQIDKFLVFDNNNNIIYNNRKPFILHGPGATYLDNVIIKLGYDYKDDIKNLIKKKYGSFFIMMNEYYYVSTPLTLLILFIAIFLLFYCLILLYNYFS